MPPAAAALGPVILAAVLATAAVGKLRAPSRSAEALVALDVPRPLRARWLVGSHPWVEIALALGLVLATGWLGTAFAIAAAPLFVGYLVLIARAATKPEPVDCDCFGVLGAGQVTRVTVARNIWYVILAAVAIGAHASGSSPLPTLSSLGAEGWWWLAAAAAAALTVGLTMHGQGEGDSAASEQMDDDLADYVRMPTPAVPVKLVGGTETTLRDLSARRAQLLLFVSRSCGWCSEVVTQSVDWRAELPQLDVRLVFSTAPKNGGVDPETTIYDERSWARQSCGITSVPAAVALGRDGLLAGGPVMGHLAVTEFVAQIREQLG